MNLFANRLARRAQLVAGLFLVAGAAQAQATRTWVSGVGDDINPCSRTAPCKTFAGAISKTAAGGQISILDPGGYGAVTITKSIIIDGAGIEGSIVAGGTAGVIVNGTNITVTLRNLHINGAPPNTPGTTGVRFLNGSALHIERCTITNFRSAASGSGNAILVDTAVAGTHRLFVSESMISENGSGNEGGGIRIAPVGVTTFVFAKIDNTHIQSNNGFGIKTGDNSFVTVTDSHIDGNTRSGVRVTGTTTTADLLLHNTVLSDNGSANSANEAAVMSIGANGFVHLSQNVITENEMGVRRLSGGSAFSYGDNKMVSNTANGTVNASAEVKL